MIPRASWVGSPAFTNFKWPGDLSCSFADSGLPSSVYSLLSLAFCGIPFVSTDIGGFEGRPSPEQVWVRWAQFGAMIPGMQTLNMPWWYSEKAIEHFRLLAWLHTQLTPLWMTLAREAHNTGAPVCRPLIWDYQKDTGCWNVDDEFIIGRSLLVAPILDAGNTREVYFPEGRWIDFWNEKKVLTGKQTIKWTGDAKDNNWSFPLYIREGAIIPLEVKNNVTKFGWEESKDFVTFAIWPKINGKSKFTLHDIGKPVEILVNGCKKSKIHVVWNDDINNYIFRIHINNLIRKLDVKLNGSRLNRFNDQISFRKNKVDGWYFNNKSGNLWIKKYSIDKDKNEQTYNESNIIVEF